ncbi:hypothetical protein F53441_1815 [Fusarium austroafricanum]|uniref:Uncharacterized protein n=1 Tax=Fusarium austroafricanum TaxID=2364996 RepID=A0A8H4KUG9_9HYPO|nr:hypothetical protein F53441_1815 [Fusarium austroafricanum]
MPALPPISPRDIANSVKDTTTSLLYRRFDVWVYDYDDDDDHHNHDLDDDWWDDHRHRRLSKEMIIVICACVLVAAGIISLLAFFLTRRKKCRYRYQRPVDAAPLVRPPGTGQGYENFNPQPPYHSYGQESRDMPEPPPYTSQAPYSSQK